ncbi:hypothetical protein GX50_05772 [[Emmonsia] crescens]|uniref:Uncharacterized protein n=1 Tax=[Emmonsia] crescens TaxID=73230 RepID=A0A2B7ZE43_9EURO|nr:hypothetical protein GX50_05772 [Emmonsia crescens]
MADSSRHTGHVEWLTAGDILPTASYDTTKTGAATTSPTRWSLSTSSSSRYSLKKMRDKHGWLQVGTEGGLFTCSSQSVTVSTDEECEERGSEKGGQ